MVRIASKNKRKAGIRGILKKLPVKKRKLSYELKRGTIALQTEPSFLFLG